MQVERSSFRNQVSDGPRAIRELLLPNLTIDFNAIVLQGWLPPLRNAALIVEKKKKYIARVIKLLLHK